MRTALMPVALPSRSLFCPDRAAGDANRVSDCDMCPLTCCLLATPALRAAPMLVTVPACCAGPMRGDALRAPDVEGALAVACAPPCAAAALLPLLCRSAALAAALAALERLRCRCSAAACAASCSASVVSDRDCSSATTSVCALPLATRTLLAREACAGALALPTCRAATWPPRPCGAFIPSAPPALALC